MSFSQGLLVILFGFVPLAVPQSPRPNEKKAEAADNQNQTKTKAKAIPQTLSPSVSVTQIAPVTIENWPQQKFSSPWWDAFVSNWPLFVVGAFGTIAAVCTLVAIKKQVKANVMAAKAAKRTANMLVNSERAWVIVSKTQGTRIEAGRVSFGACFKNYGRTVARLTGPFRWQCAVLRGLEALPDIPDYSRSVAYTPDVPESPIHGRVLAPGQRYEPAAFVSSDAGIVPEEINGNTARLYFYASLKYVDFANIERELQFCYNFIPGSAELGIGAWVLAGPKEYNKHT